MSTSTIGIKVSEDTRDRLRALAEARDRSPHWIACKALAEYLEREERVESERLEDQQRWERYVLTGEAVAHDRVRDWLGALAQGKAADCPR